MERHKGRKFSFIWAAVVLAGVTSLASTEVRAQWIWVHAYYNESMCWDNYARTGIVWAYPCNGQANQQWTWQETSPGSRQWKIYLRERTSNGTQLCLAVPKTASFGSPIYLQDCNTTDTNWALTWRWVDTYVHPYFRLETAGTEYLNCVGVSGGTSGAQPLSLSYCDWWNPTYSP